MSGAFVGLCVMALIYLGQIDIEDDSKFVIDVVALFMFFLSLIAWPIVLKDLFSVEMRR